VQPYVGCSGWSYDAWLGHFYPATIISLPLDSQAN
jgi:uncharacterized protein YecE (DUF72 family)